MTNKTKLFDEYENKFCKIVVDTSLGEKSLKGFLKFDDGLVLVKGNYQQTLLKIEDVKRISLLTESGGNERK